MMINHRQLAFAITILLLPLSAIAQTPKADSLIRKLHATETDTSKFRLLCKISQELKPIDPDAAYNYSVEALKLGEKLGDPDMQAEAHIDIGNCLDFQGRYMEEMDHFLKGLAIYETTQNEKGLASAYNSMGTLLYNMENYEKALQFYRKGHEIRSRIGKKEPISASLNNMGIALMDMGNLDSARYFFNAAMKINIETGNRSWQSTNLHNLGQIFYYEKKYDSSIVLLERALHIREDLESRVGMVNSHLALGNVRELSGDYEGSERDYKMAYIAGKEMNSPRVLRKASRGLAVVYTRLKKYQTATVFFEEYLEADDSLESSTLTSSITSGLLDKEKEAREKELKADAEKEHLIQDAVIQKQQYYFWLAAAGLLFMILLAVFLFYLYYSRRRTTRLLERKVEERTRKLVHANTELDKFIYQSSHDLRSPITSIRGLADIALSEAGKDDPSRYLTLIKDRAEHMDGVYSNLIHTMNIRDRVMKKERISLRDLFTRLEEELRKSRNQHNLLLEYNLKLEAITTDPLLMLQILRSIAMNALDFADAKRQPVCRIQVQPSGAGWQMTLTDNGTGIAPEAMPKIFDMFFRGSNKSRGSGLGLYNARIAAEKLGVQLTAKTIPGEGSTFTISAKE